MTEIMPPCCYIWAAIEFPFITSVDVVTVCTRYKILIIKMTFEGNKVTVTLFSVWQDFSNILESLCEKTYEIATDLLS